MKLSHSHWNGMKNLKAVLFGFSCGCALLAWPSAASSQNLLSSSNWYMGGSTSATWSDGTHSEGTSLASSTQVVTTSSMTLAQTATNATVSLWTYFTPTTLLASDATATSGDSVTLSFTLSTTATPLASSDLLRMGLFNSLATSTTAKDTTLWSSSTTVTGSSTYTGDSAWTYLNSTAGTSNAAYSHIASTSGALLYSGTANTALTSATAGAGLKSTTPVTLSLTYTLTTGGLVLTESANGTTLFTATDTSVTGNYTLDTLYLYEANGVVDTLTLSNLSLTYAAVPEPSVSLLLLATGTGMLLFRRLRPLHRSKV